MSFKKAKCLNSLFCIARRTFHTNWYGLLKQLPFKADVRCLLMNSASFNKQGHEDDVWTTPSYPEKKRLQSEKSFQAKVDPSQTSVILFPGQGSQYVGMTKSLVKYPNVKEMFECASSILRYDLLDLCLNGPEDMLNMTAHCQVAVMVASLAAVEKLRATAEEAIINCAATAGFSVGEYAALVFSGALEFQDAVKLLKIRGEAMQASSDLEPSGMMTVFLKPEAKIKAACAAAKEWCKEQTTYDAECRVAIYLFPDCRVISGHLEALKFIEYNAVEFGIKKFKYLPVSGAFHSNLMKPAQKVLTKALQSTPFKLPLIPVYSNIGGFPYTSVDQIKDCLARLLSSPVEWEQLMHAMFERPKGAKFPNVYECGPGTSIKTILRMNNYLAFKNCESILA